MDGSLSGGDLGFELARGGTPAPGLVIGGGLYLGGTGRPRFRSLMVNGYSRGGVDPQGVSFVLLGPMVDWYVNPKKGWHVQGALGIAAMHADPFVDSNRPRDVTRSRDLGGFGVLFGGGCDLWVSDQWSLGALLRLTYVTAETNRSAPERWSYQALAPELLFSATFH